MSGKSALIVAGGKGLRMKQSTPKQFTILAGKPVVVRTIETFLRFDPNISIILVLSEDLFPDWEKIREAHLPHEKIVVAQGGNTRFQSVNSGLNLVKEELVAIHDAVRPLVSIHSIGQSFEAAATTGSGIVAVRLKDSIRRKNSDGTTHTEDRSLFYTVQTPQTFQTSLIKKAFQLKEQENFTDDASVYETAGMKVTLVEGDYTNLKITTPEDLWIAEAILKSGSYRES